MACHKYWCIYTIYTILIYNDVYYVYIVICKVTAWPVTKMYTLLCQRNETFLGKINNWSELQQHFTAFRFHHYCHLIVSPYLQTAAHPHIQYPHISSVSYCHTLFRFYDTKFGFIKPEWMRHKEWACGVTARRSAQCAVSDSCFCPNNSGRSQSQLALKTSICRWSFSWQLTVPGTMMMTGAFLPIGQRTQW